MLQQLRVENYALIESLEIDFNRGLNIITGETGAGKSILLGALGLLLGGKSESGVQRDASRSCTIEGVFEIDRATFEEWFDENDLEWEPQVSIRRVITASGKSRAFIGDMPVQLSVLRELGDRLIDIHSQHRNLLIKDDSFRLNVVDGVAEQHALVAEYSAEYHRLGALRRRLAEMQREVEEYRRQYDYISFQYQELSTAKLKEGEQQELEEEYAMLTNADRIGEAVGGALASLDEEQTGALMRVRAMAGDLSRVADIFPRVAPLAERLQSAYVELRDIAAELGDVVDSVGADESRLESVSTRINTIYDLQQKHRVTSVAELLALQEEYRTKLEAMDTSSENSARMREEIAAVEQHCHTLADRITEGRRKAAPVISQSVKSMLSRLGIASAVFEVSIEPTEELSANGADCVEFLFSANPGMPARSIDRIASGGEISRVMLALKALMASRAGLPTIIFDEIDTGVSGRVADEVGEIVAEMGHGMQVINITHLPQVASKGDSHLLVYKTDGATHIRKLSTEERVEHIAAMLSGSTITAAAQQQARELLGL
ncbi:MAG: DNA repair protein RecN [Rikenellaceae bacterium]|nr:DNA repair protein RecN [Rikenellaceae bacterium]